MDPQQATLEQFGLTHAVGVSRTIQGRDPRVVSITPCEDLDRCRLRVFVGGQHLAALGLAANAVVFGKVYQSEDMTTVGVALSDVHLPGYAKAKRVKSGASFQLPVDRSRLVHADSTSPMVMNRVLVMEGHAAGGA